MIEAAGFRQVKRFRYLQFTSPANLNFCGDSPVWTIETNFFLRAKLVSVQISADIVDNAIPNHVLNSGLYSASVGNLSLVTPRQTWQ